MNFSQKIEQSNWANSVRADEVSSSDYKRLFSLLEAIYAVPWIPEPSTVNNKLKRREGSGSTGRFFD